MRIINWLKIIAYILKLIAEGQSKEAAVNSAAEHFDISASDIWQHGGF